MKLSKVLKDWPKKWKPIKTLSNGDPRCEGFNQALTSCDREIDRDALENVLLNMIVDFISEESMESADKIHGYKDRIVDSFISTMPTWLKPIERK